VNTTAEPDVEVLRHRLTDCVVVPYRIHFKHYLGRGAPSLRAPTPTV
jgi:hypothetical protein